MADTSFIPLNEAIGKSLTMGGLELLLDVKRFVGAVIDLADSDLDEVKLFRIQVDSELLEPLVSAAHDASENTLCEAENRISNVLIHDRVANDVASKKLAYSLSAGVALFLHIPYHQFREPMAATIIEPAPQYWETPQPTAPRPAAASAGTGDLALCQSTMTLANKSYEIARAAHEEDAERVRRAEESLNNSAKKMKSLHITLVAAVIAFALSLLIVPDILATTASVTAGMTYVNAHEVHFTETMYIDPFNTYILVVVLLIGIVYLFCLLRYIGARNSAREELRLAQLAEQQFEVHQRDLELTNRRLSVASSRLQRSEPGTPEYESALREFQSVSNGLRW